MVQFKAKQVNCEQALELPPPECPKLPVVFVVAAALIDKDSRVLIAQRPEGKDMAGLWEFPGGKVMQEEQPEYALMRELEEELSIITRPCCFSPIGFTSHSYSTFHLVMPLYACRVWKGPIKANEGQMTKWVFPKELYNYEMPEADIPLISQVNDLL